MEEIYAVCGKMCQDQTLKYHGQAMAVLVYLLREIPGRGIDSAVIRRADIAAAIGIGDLGGVTRDLRLPRIVAKSRSSGRRIGRPPYPCARNDHSDKSDT